MIETFVILIILSILTIGANFALEERKLMRWLQVALLLVNLIWLVVSGMYVVVATMDETMRQAMQMPEIELTNALSAFGVFSITIALATLLLSQRFRLWLVPFFPRRQSPSVQYQFDRALMPVDPNAESLQGYDPKNPVHMMALVFCVYFLGLQFGNFALVGGLEGVAEGLSVNWTSLILNFLPLVIIPLLGVGFLMRRSWSQVCQRLGFTNLTFESIAVGVVTSIVMFFGVMGVSVLMTFYVSSSTMEEQNAASNALAESITTIWLALGVAVTAAVGEEIAFRGALQPVIGFWATALVFSLTHIQYTLTPAVLIIFFVALALGWLRQRYNLYAAITAHFLYNFIGLVIVLLLR